MGSPGGAQRVYDMCINALKAGYRHFDTADGYKNEEEVGRALRDGGVPRKEIFVTTKLYTAPLCLLLCPGPDSGPRCGC